MFLFPVPLIGMGGAAYVGPGDVVSGASAWWGLRAYSAASIGNNAVRLRRSSDNAEQDFPTIAGGGLDAAAITSFKGGAATLTVRTLYDQTGNGNDATIVGGTATFNISDLNSLPTFTCSNGLGTEFNASGPTIANQPFTVSSVFIDDSSGGSFPVLFRSGAGCDIFVEISSVPTVRLADGGTFDASISASTWYALQAVFNNTSSTAYINGSGTNGSVAGTDGVGGTLRLWWNGLTARCTEMGVWASAFNGTEQSLIDNNQRSYWGF